MSAQTCPNCQISHDTSVYVSGQKIQCRCGIRFEVKRKDVTVLQRRTTRMSAPAPEPAVELSPPLQAAALAAAPLLEPVVSVAAPVPVTPSEVAAAQAPTLVRLQAAAVSAEPERHGRPEQPAAPLLAVAPASALLPNAVLAPAAQPADGPAADRATPTRNDRPADPAATAVRPPSEEILAQAQGPAVVDTPPTIDVPGYEFQGLLGRGGMGEVWRAFQKSLQRTVAIKVLPARLAEDPEFVARFEKEAAALALVQHPNVIQIFDRGVAYERAPAAAIAPPAADAPVGTGHYYFVMEYVAGKSVRDLISGGRVSAELALKLVGQICRAIECAHDHHVIHRDLKPENILVDERSHVKVADFGLAGFRNAEPQQKALTHTKVAMGTLHYMAPEQRRDAKSVDGRADLYSVGVILYELLTGELPMGRFKLPSERDPSLDPRIDEVISRALEPEPSARYQSAAEVARAIEALLSTAQLPADPKFSAPRPAGRPAGPSSSRSVIEKGWTGLRVGLMVVGALTLVGLVVKMPWSRGHEAGTGRSHSASARTGGAPAFPPNTDGPIYVSATVNEPASGLATWASSFDSGEQELNAHAGAWSAEHGKLVVTQAGVETAGEALVPRAYLAHRYFSSDELSAEVEVSYQQPNFDAALEEGHQHYTELAFRIKGVQVSIFAIPEVGMRLLWHYSTQDGIEVVGNSARDVDNMVDDEMPVPAPGDGFRLRLTMKRQKTGTLVEAFVNNQRFARKLLIGLSGQTGKVALGCRNLHCEFDNLKITAPRRERPSVKVSEAEEH